ncbi:MerR family transcriptional regulator [Streptomyces montanus]|uniref:MerR family transcriptional regulator n=1 Tax=Streptomyces montanus TaxID=2580423 RepID=A0A5R9G1I5_9ACTN|nr:MerR family transcriptional regulator [Streptomyces montanus]TLS46664.1 MerR family transcriptional regulator [Streptomyces montanus]
MSNDNLLSIGSFALLSGLSLHALRHYDEVGLLPPAVVDPDTGYRRYRPDQVQRARLIGALRKVDLPLHEIRRLLDAPDPVTGQAVLARHRQELAERAHTLSRMVHTVDHFIEHGVAVPQVTSPRIVQVTINVHDLNEARAFYGQVFAAEFNEEIFSFQIGTWPGEEFFLLTVAHEPDHPGPAGPSRFGLLVADLDTVHQRALDAGATEVEAPVDRPWKPRSSCLTDPSGNRIDLFQS